VVGCFYPQQEAGGVQYVQQYVPAAPMQAQIQYVQAPQEQVQYYAQVEPHEYTAYYEREPGPPPQQYVQAPANGQQYVQIPVPPPPLEVQPSYSPEAVAVAQGYSHTQPVHAGVAPPHYAQAEAPALPPHDAGA
jgi:hypothetical protein